MITILHDQTQVTAPDSARDGDALWLGAPDIQAATGWHWKPEGLCHGEVCVPVPPAARGTLVRESAGQPQLDIAAMWRRSGQPVVRDEAGHTWVLGTGAAQRSQALASLQAPDFELPDLDGRMHRLSDLRGRKVFLTTWASW